MNQSGSILYFPHGGGPLPLMNDPGHALMNQFLRGFPSSITQPESIVVISAHWEEPVIAITAAASPPMLYDYHGFPPETYQYRYPAPGNPELAAQIQNLFIQAGIESKLDDTRGYDHGLFVPLLLMYPEAEIPCIQISLSATLDAAEHVAIGKALAALKDRNLLILGSGFSFHNMSALINKKDASVDPRNREFEDWLEQTCCDQGLSESQRASRLVNWESAPQARYCHPREEHLLPLQVCYGIGQSAAKLVFQDLVAGFICSAYQW